MALNQELIEMLMCPISRENVKPADAALIQQLNQRIEQKTLKNKAGEGISQKIEEGLVSAGTPQYFYIIRDGIPVMLPDEAIPLTVK